MLEALPGVAYMDERPRAGMHADGGKQSTPYPSIYRGRMDIGRRAFVVAHISIIESIRYRQSARLAPRLARNETRSAVLYC